VRERTGSTGCRAELVASSPAEFRASSRRRPSGSPASSAAPAFRWI